MIYHTITPEDWVKFNNKSHYEAESLQTEGFIHCSTEDQVRGIVERFYSSVDNLLALCIDESLLDSELKYEPVPGTDQLYPHIFGPIDKEAITSIDVIKINGRINW